MEKYSKYTYNPELEKLREPVYKRIKLLLEMEKSRGDLILQKRGLGGIDELEELVLFKEQRKMKEDVQKEIGYKINENETYLKVMRELELERLWLVRKAYISDFQVYQLESTKQLMIMALLESEKIKQIGLQNNHPPYSLYISEYIHPYGFFRDSIEKGLPIDIPFIQNKTDEGGRSFSRVYTPVYIDVPSEERDEIIELINESPFNRDIR